MLSCIVFESVVISSTVYKNACHGHNFIYYFVLQRKNRKEKQNRNKVKQTKDLSCVVSAHIIAHVIALPESHSLLFSLIFPFLSTHAPTRFEEGDIMLYKLFTVVHILLTSHFKPTFLCIELPHVFLTLQANYILIVNSFNHN